MCSSSCAIFAADGGLVANAPHIPVHLGAMSHAVRYQAEVLGNELEEGDVILSNHPVAGGSHLPDLTIIMPAFHEGRIVFWTAARAHHADIGGVSFSLASLLLVTRLFICIVLHCSSKG